MDAYRCSMAPTGHPSCAWEAASRDDSGTSASMATATSFGMEKTSGQVDAHSPHPMQVSFTKYLIRNVFSIFPSIILSAKVATISIPFGNKCYQTENNSSSLRKRCTLVFHLIALLLSKITARLVAGHIRFLPFLGGHAPKISLDFRP